MAITNIKSKRSHIYEEEARLAGGYGESAAKQRADEQLRRLVLTCLLWEDNAYIDGKSTVAEIKRLVHLVPAAVVAKLAIEARFEQRLRHVPLLLCRELARHESGNLVLAKTMERVIHRPDELAEFLSLYWSDNFKDAEDETPIRKKSLSAQVKKGLAAAFRKFDEYQLAKWNKSGKSVSLRDVLFLCHAKPKDKDQEALWKRLVEGTLASPDTWEVGLSAAKTNEEKRAVWERLITTNALRPFAFLKNLRNMLEVGVAPAVIKGYLTSIKTDMLLPLDFLKAAGFARDYRAELEQAMFRCAAGFPKLPGWTIFVLDVSGSMGAKLSDKSDFCRLDAGLAMAVLAAEMCESITIYATAGNDSTREHTTARLRPVRGFGLCDEVLKDRLGGGGIFTRQCLDYIRDHEDGVPDRIVVFSDSQDCDNVRKLPRPFGRHNYIVDVSSHKHGIAYSGVWDSEISGWSGQFLSYIASCEGIVQPNQLDENQ